MNEQEKFWTGNFGDNYTKRSIDQKAVLNNKFFFLKIFEKKKINSVLELGANIGYNILAIKKIFRKLKNITCVEINKFAYKELIKIKGIDSINESLIKFQSKKKYELVFTKGVLIHLNPNSLKNVYKKMGKFSSKYVLIAEYYNPTPTKVDYRGNKNKLFKRDFAQEFLKENEKFKLIDYGFTYRKDRYPQDDLTWFLFKRKTN